MKNISKKWKLFSLNYIKFQIISEGAVTGKFKFHPSLCHLGTQSSFKKAKFQQAQTGNKSENSWKQLRYQVCKTFQIWNYLEILIDSPFFFQIKKGKKVTISNIAQQRLQWYHVN